jgi:hypothetical protein
VNARLALGNPLGCLSGFPLIDRAVRSAIRLRRVPDNLRCIARDLILAGDLPRTPAALTLAGIADDTHHCVLCGERITGPIEFRLRFGHDTALHFHGRCHDAWLAERQALETP